VHDCACVCSSYVPLLEANERACGIEAYGVSHKGKIEMAAQGAGSSVRRDGDHTVPLSVCSGKGMRVGSLPFTRKAQ